MQQITETSFDAASALIVGQRDHQEDAVVADFPLGADTGLVVLSDGMGGHAAGDVASKIVMTEVFCELKFRSGDPEELAENTVGILHDALRGANECLAAHMADNPESRGMGATLIAAVFRDNRLHWISVGDSPLYLYRDGMLRQLNEDHSMAPQIDMMADTGMIDPETARDHPDRNALISVLAGDEIAKIDCPEEPFELRHGDVVIAASDGLQFMDDDRIATVLRDTRGAPSAKVAQALLNGIEGLGDPDQDNTSMTVVRISQAAKDADVADAVRSAFSFALSFDEEDGEASEDGDAPAADDAEPQADAGAGDPAEDAASLKDDIAAIALAYSEQDTDDEAGEGADETADVLILTDSIRMVPDAEDDADGASDADADAGDEPSLALGEDDADAGLAEVDETIVAEAADAGDTGPAGAVAEAEIAPSDNENIFDEPTGDGAEETGEDWGEEADDDVEHPELKEACEGATVSIRAEPRNERRPGAPILRRIVVEASR